MNPIDYNAHINSEIDYQEQENPCYKPSSTSTGTSTTTQTTGSKEQS